MADAWEIVLQGINSQEREVTLAHRKRDKKSENGLESDRITAHDLESLIKEAGEPARLRNLTLTASQKAPSRKAIIKIGSGRRTNIFVEAEADDYTWMSNTHKELIDKFTETQKWYAPSGWWKIGDKSGKLMDRISSLPLLVALVLLALLVVLALVIVAYYYFIVIQVPYELITGLVHHKKWSGSDTFYALTSFAVIYATWRVISLALAGDQSFVIAKPSAPLLTRDRIKNIFKVAAAIAAFIASIIAIVTFFK